MTATYRLTRPLALTFLFVIALFAAMAVLFDGADTTSGRARLLAGLPVPVVRWGFGLLAAFVAVMLALLWRAQATGKAVFRIDDEGVSWWSIFGMTRSLPWSGVERATMQGTNLNIIGRDHTGRAVTVPLPLSGQDRDAVRAAIGRHAPGFAGLI